MTIESQSSPNEMNLSSQELAACIDHTLLKPEATEEQIVRLCEEARRYGFGAVCVNGRWVSTAADAVQGSAVKVATVISFPLGADTTKAKATQIKEAVYNGADEIDMVADLPAIIAGDTPYLTRQFRAATDACRCMRPPVTLKVIIESAALTTNQKALVCEIAQQIGVDFIKTSTGLHPAGGATVEDVRLIKETAPQCKIKASGGIRTAEQALAMLAAGASRIGASAGVQIIDEFKARQ